MRRLASGNNIPDQQNADDVQTYTRRPPDQIDGGKNWQQTNKFLLQMMYKLDTVR